MSRIVFTGMGVIAPNGGTKDRYWSALREGKRGIRRIERFDPSPYASQLAGEIPEEEFHPEELIPKPLLVQTDRWTWLALAAAQMALEDAQFDPSKFDPYRTSVVTSSSSGGNEFGQREIQSLWGRGPIYVGAYQSIAWFYAASTGQLSIRHGVKGPNGVVVTESAGGLDALQQSRRTMRRGVDAVICGGTEAPISPYAIVCQMANRLISAHTDPAIAYRPFDRRASGYVPGEGGAFFLVEQLEQAQSRGAPQIYGEIVGYGATQDAFHPARPAPDAKQLGRSIALALREAGIGPPDVDAILLDAVGHPEWDALEVRALKDVFGECAKQVPVTTPKPFVGRMHSGAAALDVATALLAIRDNYIPPMQPEPLDEPYGLNFVSGRGIEKNLNHVLIVARGYGGFNSALVLRKFVP